MKEILIFFIDMLVYSFKHWSCEQHAVAHYCHQGVSVTNNQSVDYQWLSHSRASIPKVSL